MKKIKLIFFTFLGITAGFSQNPAVTGDSNHIMGNTIANTPPIKSELQGIKEKPVIRLYPNPAKNKVEIEIKGFEPGHVQIQLRDKKGNLLRDEKRFVFSGNEVIVLMFSESPGLYFVLLKQGKNNLKTRLVIQ